MNYRYSEKMTEENLSYENLKNANLSFVDLIDADLSGAHGCKKLTQISEEQKKSVHC